MADYADVINTPLDCDVCPDQQSVPVPKAFGVSEAAESIRQADARRFCAP
jgi:hypothetical protein